MKQYFGVATLQFHCISCASLHCSYPSDLSIPILFFSYMGLGPCFLAFVPHFKARVMCPATVPQRGTCRIITTLGPCGSGSGGPLESQLVQQCLVTNNVIVERGTWLLRSSLQRTQIGSTATVCWGMTSCVRNDSFLYLHRLAGCSAPARA